MIPLQLHTKAELKLWADKSIDKNFDSYSKYINVQFKHFHELHDSVYQITMCLIHGWNFPAITHTNFLLERLMKMALFSNVVGVTSLDVSKWDENFGEGHEFVDDAELSNTINRSCSQGLITKDEKIQLNEFRESIRNGFSHATVNKMLKHAPDKISVSQVGLTSGLEPKKIEINPKLFPATQAILMRQFVDKTAVIYFDYVFNLIDKISERLFENEKNKP